MRRPVDGVTMPVGPRSFADAGGDADVRRSARGGETVGGTSPGVPVGGSARAGAASWRCSRGRGSRPDAACPARCARGEEARLSLATGTRCRGGGRRRHPGGERAARRASGHLRGATERDRGAGVGRSRASRPPVPGTGHRLGGSRTVDPRRRRAGDRIHRPCGDRGAPRPRGSSGHRGRPRRAARDARGDPGARGPGGGARGPRDVLRHRGVLRRLHPDLGRGGHGSRHLPRTRGRGGEPDERRSIVGGRCGGGFASSAGHPRRAGATRGRRAVRARQRQQPAEPAQPLRRQIASRAHGFATLLFDLLTPEEERDRANVFDIELLADRLGMATGWLRERADVGASPIGLLRGEHRRGGGTAGGGARPGRVAAVVSRGGRPDLAAPRLAHVARAHAAHRRRDDDPGVLGLNQEAMRAAALRATSSSWCPARRTSSRSPARSSGWPIWPSTGSSASPVRASKMLRGSTGTKDCARRGTVETVQLERIAHR